MKDLEVKRKVSEMRTGGHLAVISDMFLLRNANREPIRSPEGHPSIVIQFKNGKNQLHEKSYMMDGDKFQKYFENVLAAAQVPNYKNGPDKKDIIGKRLWIFISECHYVDDDQIIMDIDGNPKIDYFIFKVFPFIEGGKKPSVKGDPEDNNGIPTGDFVTYKNESGELQPKPSMSYTDSVVSSMREEEAPVEDEAPWFEASPNEDSTVVTITEPVKPEEDEFVFPDDDQPVKKEDNKSTDDEFDTIIDFD